MKKCLIKDRHTAMTCERCFYCNKKINPSFQEKTRKAVDETPKEKKQELLDLMHEGKKLGQAMKITGLDGMVAAQIILDNVEHHGYDSLRKEAI